jgi:lysophospholipase L1-like esterase
MYSAVIQQKTLILSDSLCGNINTRFLRNHIDTSKEDCVLRKLPGQTAEDILHGSDFFLEKQKGNQAIIIAGTNDITNGIYRNDLDVTKIAADIIGIGLKCRENGASKVVISTIPPHKHRSRETDLALNNAINDVNLILLEQCQKYDFVLMDHGIQKKHLWQDGLHLSDKGMLLMKMNILRQFHTFDESICDFKRQYESAL